MVVFSLAVDDVERTVTIQLDGDEFTMEFLDAPEEEVRTCIIILSYLMWKAQNGLDWLQSFKHWFLNVSYYILVASLILMALLQSHQS